MDFFNSYHGLRAFTYKNQALIVYFPTTFFIFYPLTLLNKYIAFALFNSIFFIFTFYFLKFGTHQLVTQSKGGWLCNPTLFIFFTLPFIYCVDRGNIEIILFILLSLSIICFYKEKYNVSALLLALAASMKLYPALFALLYLKKQKFVSFLLFSIFLCLFSILSMAFLHGGFVENTKYMLHNLSMFRADYINTVAGIRQSSSILSVIKAIYLFTHTQLTEIQFNLIVERIVPVYTITSLISIIGIVIFILFFDIELWKQLTLLTISIIIFPSVSFNYKLIHLLIPLTLFLKRPRQENQPMDIVYLFYFILLIIPSNYFIYSVSLTQFSSAPADLKISSSIFVTTITMIVFLITIITQKIFNVKQRENIL